MKQAGQFDARVKAAQQFDIRQHNLAGLAPQVAGLDALQQDAQQLAAPQQGLGSFQPFLTAAQMINWTTCFSTTVMSPYQQQVIDTSLAEFDRQAANARQQ